MSETIPGSVHEVDDTADTVAADASSAAPVRRRRTRWTRRRITWSALAVVVLAWAVWAFVDDATLLVSLTGAGLAEGAIVALAALGFIVTWNATGIANFAQGDLITVAAFLGAWATGTSAPGSPIVDGLGLSLGLGYLLTLALMFVLGVGIERVAYAPIRRRRPDIHVVVIATLGAAIILRTVLGLWQGSDPRFLQSWFNTGGSLQNLGFFQNGTWTITIGFLGVHNAVIAEQRVLIIVVTALVVLLMMWLFGRTSFGRQLRALAADRETAQLYGVRASRLSMLAFGLSAVLAGLAGLLIGPLGSFDLTVGFSYMLLGFAAAVLGGFGSIGGTVAGGVIIGLADQLFGGQMVPLLGSKIGINPADVLRFQSIFPYIAMLIVIAIKPQGVFGRTQQRL